MSQEYTPIFHYNFTKEFNTYDFEHKIAHDGQISRDMRGLSIYSGKYNAHVDPGLNGLLNHIKSLTFLCKSYKTKELSEGEIIYEACVAAQQIISPEIVPEIYRNRIRNIHEDYRLCSSGLVVYDEDSMITAKILFTNDWIYGYYDRRPGYKLSWIQSNNSYKNCILGSHDSNFSDYASFVSIVPLCKRGAFSPICREGILDDYIRVGIGIDSCKGTIKFYVNRVEMFCIHKIGYRLDDKYQVTEYGGIPYLTVPGTLRFGFGHFSFLDHNIPNNYARQYITEVSDSNGYPIHRSRSGLAQLLPTDKYREPYPDFTGAYRLIDPATYFAYTGSDVSLFNFGQGMITRIKYIACYIVNNRVPMYKKPSHNINCSDSSQNCSEYDYTEKYANFNGTDMVRSPDSTERAIYGTHKDYTSQNKIYDSNVSIGDIYGPIPEPSEFNNPLRLKHQSIHKYQEKSEQSGSLRELLMKSTIVNNTQKSSQNTIPLYRDLSSKISGISTRSTGNTPTETYPTKGYSGEALKGVTKGYSNELSNYTLGDLYKRSKTTKFMAKGEKEEKEENKEQIGNYEEIGFASNDMTLYI